MSDKPTSLTKQTAKEIYRRWKALLVCTRESPLRLLEPVELTPNLYSTFCTHCRRKKYIA